MEKSKTHKKDEVIELVKLCGNYCATIEKGEKLSLHELLDNISVNLMAVYQRTFTVTRFQTKYESEPQHFLTEKQYNKVREGLLSMLEKKDQYTEIFDPNKPTARNAFQASISEDLTDIYQDFYDFVQWYGVGTFESVNDSVIELLNNFDKYWGIKLLNVLRAIHYIRYVKKDASLFRDPLGDEDADIEPFDDQQVDSDSISDFLTEEL